MFKQNESSADRVIRAIAGIIFFILGYFWLAGAWQIIFYILGIALLGTGLTGFCGLYSIFGINTKK